MTEQKEHEIDIQLSAHAAAIRDSNMELTSTRLEINKLKDDVQKLIQRTDAIRGAVSGSPDRLAYDIASLAKKTGVSITVSFYPFDNNDEE